MITGPSHIPAYTLPSQNTRVLLTRRPSGIPQSSDFTVTTAALPVIEAGQFLVRNIYLSVDPAQRGWVAASANYTVPVAIGSVMRALAVGVVVESSDPSIAEGSFLYGWFGWQDYCAADASLVLAHAASPLPLSAHAGLLGINGLTAYLALTGCGRPVAGDVLLVSTAAGAVGSLVGQIGRLLGCRTIGLTGDEAKRHLCMDRFGFDAAFNYREDDLDQVAAAVGASFNIYFDNVGGSILDGALRNMAAGGRVVQCGTAATATWDPPPTGLRNEREVLTRRLCWSGFIIFDHVAQFPAAQAQLAQWWSEGRLRIEEDILEGIEAAPGAIARLYAGHNRGKQLIQLGLADRAGTHPKPAA